VDAFLRDFREFIVLLFFPGEHAGVVGRCGTLGIFDHEYFLKKGMTLI
jgi:hypothetical protein